MYKTPVFARANGCARNAVIRVYGRDNWLAGRWDHMKEPRSLSEEFDEFTGR